jgi:hypothetical protein
MDVSEKIKDHVINCYMFREEPVFIGNVEINNSEVFLENNGYTIQATTLNNRIVIYNFASPDGTVNSSPIDGILEAVITPIKSTWLGKKAIKGTVLPFTSLRISSQAQEQVSILSDEQTIMKTPAEIKIAPQKLKVIVGPERCF